MIDTIELTYKLHDNANIDLLYNAINTFVKRISNKHLYTSPRFKTPYKLRYITDAFFPYGILELAIEKVNFLGVSYNLIAKYKPAQVIYRNDPYALSGPDDYDRAVSNFNDFIDTLNSHMINQRLPHIELWQVNRLDYAFEIFTPNYEEYLKLLRKGCYNSKADKHETSVYITGRNTNMNFYDKTVELELKDDDRHNIRFEVQCKRWYLNKLLHEHEWEKNDLYHLWDKNIAINIVMNKIQQLIGTGDFYTLASAEFKLKDNFNKKKAAQLLDLLKISLYPKARRPWLPEIYSRHQEDCSAEYVKKNLLPALNKVGISPLVIPAEWKVDRLDNPAHIMV